jgi:hypothetical protein
MAAGGDVLTIDVAVPQFSAPVDFYLAYIFSADPNHIYNVKPDLSFQQFTVSYVLGAIAAGQLPPGAVPGASHIDFPAEVIPFGDIPASVLAAGTYRIFLLATPAGAASSYYLWETDFTVGPSAAVYSQPPNPGGGFYLSSRWSPDGSDYDQYVWDDFTLASARTITEVSWRGTHDPARSAYGKPVADFVVSIYGSIAAGTEPDTTNPPHCSVSYRGKCWRDPCECVRRVEYFRL